VYNAVISEPYLYSRSKRRRVCSPPTYKSYYYTHIYVCINIDASRVKAFVNRINVVATFGNVFARRRMQISVYTRVHYIYLHRRT